MRKTIVLLVSFAVVGCTAQSADQPSEEQQNKGEVVELDGLKSRLPAAWEKQKPTSRLRKFQFQIPKVQGDAKDGELAIFFFGKGSGGGVKANLARWKGQFVPPKGKAIDDVAKVKESKVGNVTVTYLDVKGTYLHKPAPFVPKATPYPDYRMFGVIFASENGPYFIKAIGPAKTMAARKKDFDSWLKSFK